MQCHGIILSVACDKISIILQCTGFNDYNFERGYTTP